MNTSRVKRGMREEMEKEEGGARRMGEGGGGRAELE
jgi:hypothetical protein